MGSILKKIISSVFVAGSVMAFLPSDLSAQALGSTRQGSGRLTKAEIHFIQNQVTQIIHETEFTPEEERAAFRYLQQALFDYPLFDIGRNGNPIDLSQYPLAFAPLIIGVGIAIFSMWFLDTPDEAQAPTVTPVRKYQPDCGRVLRDLERAFGRLRDPAELNCVQGDTRPECQVACTVLRSYANFGPLCGGDLNARISELNSAFQCWYIF